MWKFPFLSTDNHTLHAVHIASKSHILKAKFKALKKKMRLLQSWDRV